MGLCCPASFAEISLPHDLALRCYLTMLPPVDNPSRVQGSCHKPKTIQIAGPGADARTSSLTSTKGRLAHRHCSRRHLSLTTPHAVHPQTHKRSCAPILAWWIACAAAAGACSSFFRPSGAASLATVSARSLQCMTTSDVSTQKHTNGRGLLKHHRLRAIAKNDNSKMKYSYSLDNE